MRHVSAARCVNVRATERNKSSHEREQRRACHAAASPGALAGPASAPPAARAASPFCTHTHTRITTSAHKSTLLPITTPSTHMHTHARSAAHLARAVCASRAARCCSRELFALCGDPVASDARHHRIIRLRIPLGLFQRPRLARPLGAPVHRAVGAVRSLVALLAADVAAVDGGACAEEREGRRRLMRCVRVYV